MTYKISLTSIVFLVCYTLNVSAIPRLNISLPPESPIIKNSGKHLIAPQHKNIPIAHSKGLSIPNILIIKSTKNSELKAVIKRKVYGLRYTKIW